MDFKRYEFIGLIAQNLGSAAQRLPIQKLDRGFDENPHASISLGE
jgi:hypothetical protein